MYTNTWSNTALEICWRTFLKFQHTFCAITAGFHQRAKIINSLTFPYYSGSRRLSKASLPPDFMDDPLCPITNWREIAFDGSLTTAIFRVCFERCCSGGSLLSVAN